MNHVVGEEAISTPSRRPGPAYYWDEQRRIARERLAVRALLFYEADLKQGISAPTVAIYLLELFNVYKQSVTGCSSHILTSYCRS